ncbi:MAG: hypothetical protein ACOVOV_09495 [Dolichospermum sp.]
MGKLKGIIQFTGHFNGLSFYELNGKIVVRKTGGFDGEKIKKDPNYVRVRENSSEFGRCARLGKYFRTSIYSYLKPLKLPYIHNDVVRLFHNLTKLDSLNERGKRNMLLGLLTHDGNSLLKKFEFDTTTKFFSLFPFSCIVDLDTGKMNINEFDTKQLKKPKGATHVAIQFIVAGLDFEFLTPSETFTSTSQLFSLSSGVEPIIEFTASLPEKPILFGLVYVRFSQKINDQYFSLTGGGIKIIDYKFSSSLVQVSSTRGK